MTKFICITLVALLLGVVAGHDHSAGTHKHECATQGFFRADSETVYCTTDINAINRKY